MHQDGGDANEQKVKQQPQHSARNEGDFLRAISDRENGFQKRAAVASSHFACAAEDELIKKELRELSCHLPGAPRSTFLMQFSPDGTKVASTHGNHQIYVSDVRTGKHIKTLIGHPRTPWCIAFHPTSNQIVASGCLGGQVRIWDLSGGSEVWTVGSQSVIASIAFHPNDRLLVIATFNELFFWDWSKPEPFMHVSTANAKEKVRYVAFDKLGHKLITGITNNPQTRWERICTMQMPMSPPEPYMPAHRRVPPRPIIPPMVTQPVQPPVQSSVPERERRITNCYHELVQQYEMLVHRYLQIYRRPVMIDQGTDPMEVEVPTPSTSSAPTTRPDSPVPSTSGIQRPTRKSVNHPVKKWRTIFLSDSADSSSSGSSKGKSPLRPPPPPKTPPLGASIDQLKTNPNGSSSSSSSSDDDNNNDKKPVKLRQYTKVRQLNLNRDRPVESTEPTPSTSKSSSSVTMPVKFFTHLERLISNQEANGNQTLNANQADEQRDEAAANNVEESSGSGSTTRKTKLTEKRHLTNMINSAKLFVSKYKEMFQQLGIQVRDLPDPSSLPSTSGVSVKPSKSTNTNVAGESDAQQPQRKRRIPRSQRYKNILFTSSEDDTSEDEPQNKVARVVSDQKQNDKDKEQSKGEEAETVNVDQSGSPENSGTSNIPNTEESPQCITASDVARATQQVMTSNCGPTTESGRRRFLSHRLSAFRPTCLALRANRNSSGIPFRQIPIVDNSPPAASSNFAQDEVINYAERDGEEQQQTPTLPIAPPPPSTTMPSTSSGRVYHPFDPPPDVMSINPENIGIGSMYSNIVQELESTLTDVRNIRFRLGEMSDMLGNISDRLENIMIQSNTILRNLNSSLEDLPPIEEENASASSASSSTLPARPQSSPETTISLDTFLSSSWVRTYRNPLRPFAPTALPINSDHTYPLNPETSPNATLSPLHVSLQWTVTHIQRQATQLRQQVESIERIDRAMIEVAQLQMIRQMFDELHVHFGGDHRRESRMNRNVVCSVRQMMAGARISDPQPTTATDHPPAPPATPIPRASLPNAGQSNVTRTRTRKNNPRCLFFMHRQFRRQCNPLNARTSIKHRLANRRTCPPRRISAFRGCNQRVNTELSNLSMARRLEHHLLEHSRYIGQQSGGAPSGSSTRSDVGEHVIALRLNNIRCRMNRIIGQDAMDNLNVNVTSVTVDGTPRFAARQALITTLDNITRYPEANAYTTMSSTFRTQVWEIIELSLLLAELLLLQIVDSIPPLSGMNLDPERENLSMRIDQMCFRMIHNRFVGQSNQLTRSLRQLRLSMRNATEDLGRTYTARRNAMLPAGNNEQADSRQSLLDNIQSGLRTLLRLRNVREQLSGRTEDDSNFVEWYRSINEVINRYSNNTDDNSTHQTNTQPPTLSNREQQMRPPTVVVEDASSSDDNSNGTTMIMRPTRMHVFNPQPPSSLRLNHSVSSNVTRVTSYSGHNVTLTAHAPTTIPTLSVVELPANHPTAREAILSNRRAALLREMRQLLPPVPMAHRSAEVNQPSPIVDRSAQQIEGAPSLRLQVPRQGLSERLDALRAAGHLRPRFLHPWYNGSINPFDDPLDDNHRESIYESDVIPSATPNHRIQVWDFSRGDIPDITNPQKNVVVNECKIHNDASVDFSSDGKFLVTLLPAGGYLNITNRLGIYSMDWNSLGDLLFVANFEQNAVSVSLSPTNRHLVVGLATRRVSILPAENMPMARIFSLPKARGNLVSIRMLEQCRESTNSINCIRWLPIAGQGLIFGTNTGHLKQLL